MKGERIPNILLFFSYDESGNEEELFIQPISSIRSSKKVIKPTHDVEKKKKRWRNKGKKLSLPNDVAPIILMPHENESKINAEDDMLDDDIDSLPYGTMSIETIEIILLCLLLIVMIMIGQVIIPVIILRILLAPT